MALPEIHVVCGDAGAAAELGPVVQALRMAGVIAPVLIAAGTDPASITAVFTGMELLTDRTLPPEPTDGLIGRFDRMWAGQEPAAVLVAGADPAGTSAALAAAWRDIPVAHLGAGTRSDLAPAGDDPEAAARLITQVARLHLVARPVDAMNLLDEGVPAGDVLISGDDTLAPRRAAQAVAALAGFARRPAPMPVNVLPTVARFGG